MLGRTVSAPRLSQLTDGTLLTLGLKAGDYRILAVSTAILFAVSLLQERGVSIRTSVLRLPTPVRVLLLYGFMYFVLAAFAGAESAGFIYAIF